MELVITAASTATDLLVALGEGSAHIHSVREDGTLRRRHFLVGQAYTEAVWVQAQRDGQEADEAEGIEAITPRSMKSIASELHLSVAAVRRILIDMAITDEIREMDQDELEGLLLGAEEE